MASGGDRQPQVYLESYGILKPSSKDLPLLCYYGKGHNSIVKRTAIQKNYQTVATIQSLPLLLPSFIHHYYHHLPIQLCYHQMISIQTLCPHRKLGARAAFSHSWLHVGGYNFAPFFEALDMKNWRERGCT